MASTGMKINVSARKIGLNFNARGLAEVLLWAPEAVQVSLILQKGSLNLQMQKQDLGYWFLCTAEIRPGDDYLFELSLPAEQGQEEVRYWRRADPAALYLPEGISGASVAFDGAAFNWTDGQWKGLDLKKYVVYELHTGTCTPAGDFSALEEKIHHLVDLGITAIELMPVAQFSGSRNWGYDGVYPFAVQNSYGGPLALQHFVNNCHEKGLAVVLDVVYNHIGPEGNYFEDFGPYFTNKYQTPWGKAINFDDSQSDAVRHFFIENALMWFRDFHVDALRLDAVHAIRDFGSTHILAELRMRVDELSAVLGRKLTLIAESDLNDPIYINTLNNCGYGIDKQWIDEFHHALRVAAGQAQNGYYADFNGVEQLAKSYRDAYVYDGQYSPHRQKTFGAKASGNPGEQFVVFSQNHDQVGNRMLGERTGVLLSPALQRLLAGAVFVSPFIPLIFMGEEWGATDPFQFFCSFMDPSLIEKVRKGRTEEFAAFHQGETVPDPQDETTFLKSKLNWEQLNRASGQKHFTFYKDLIKLRKENAVLASLNRNNLEATAYPNQNAIRISRWNAAEKLTILLNFSDTAQQINLNINNKYIVLMDSSLSIYGGEYDQTILNGHDFYCTIPAESILILSSQNV